MRVLRRLREDDEVDLVAANFTRERAKIGKCGNDIQLRLRGQSAREDCGQNEKDFFHNLKFVCGMRAENEFKLKKNRIDVTIRRKEGLGETVRLLLQPDL